MTAESVTLRVGDREVLAAAALASFWRSAT